MQERLLLERERAEEEQRLLQQRINEAAEEERRRAEMCASLVSVSTPSHLTSGCTTLRPGYLHDSTMGIR